jgi:sugar lactone lactonase YvrE
MKTINYLAVALACLIVSSCAKKENSNDIKPPRTALSISFIDPLQGVVNDSLRIFGTGFSADTSQEKVTINGVKAVITRASSTELKVSIPARAFSGHVNVQMGGTTVVGPAYKYVVSSGVVSTLAGAGVPGYKDGPGAAAMFKSPQAIALDSLGNLYVGDVFNYRIRKVSVKDGYVSTFAGTGNLLYSDLAGRLNQFAYTSGIAVDKAGTVFVADNKYNNIRSISSDGSAITNVAGIPNGVPGYADGDAQSSLFSAPNGLAFDNSGNLFIVDQHNRAIRELKFPNKVSTFIAENSHIDFGVVWGIACFRPDNNIYVADISHNWIDRIYNDGTYMSSFGTGAAGYKDGPDGIGMEFKNPMALAIDSEYSIYVADAGNNCIRMIDAYYNAITLAGSGSGGIADGTGKAARFNQPAGLALDDINHILYVADAGNNCIRKILLQ